MKKLLLAISMIVSSIGYSQGNLSKATQGPATQAIYQSSYIKLISGEMFPVLSSPPTYKLVGTDTIQPSAYVDSATKEVRFLTKTRSYVTVSLSTTAGIKIVVPNYATMLNLATGINPYDFIVITDEKKGQSYTNYQYYPPNVIMWMAAVKEN